MTSENKRKTKGGPNPVDKHVGDRLRVRRSLLGLSQEKLAEAISLTSQQIQKYEKGMNRISAGRLFEFSRILDVPITYFYEQMQGVKSASGQNLGFSDNEQDSFDVEGDVMQNKETLNLLRVYYSVKDPGDRKEIYKFVRFMSDQVNKDAS